MILQSLLFLCYIAEFVVPLRITELAVPHSVDAGSDIEISCYYELENEDISNFYLKWWWTGADDDNIDNGSVRRQIFQRFGNTKGEVIKQDYNITIVDENTLLLSYLEPRDSGVYECEVSANFNETRKHSTMIVYTQGSGPLLQVVDIDDNNKKGEEIEKDDDNTQDNNNNKKEEDDEDDEDALVLVRCEASNVAPKPELVIKMNGVIQNVTQTIEGPRQGLYHILSTFNMSKELADDTEFCCEIFYEDQTVSHPQYEERFVYRSGDYETPSVDEVISIKDTPDDMDDDYDDAKPGGSGSRMDNSLLLLLLMIAIFFGNK